MLFSCRFKSILNIIFLLFSGQALNAGKILSDQGFKIWLMKASQNPQTFAMPYLISLKRDLNVRDEEGKTALMHTTMCGNAHGSELLVNAKVDINIQDDFGNSAVVHAVQKNDIKILTMLLKNGANANLIDNIWMTALHHAVLVKNPKAVAILLQFKADPNNRDSDGRTPLMLAAQYGNLDAEEADKYELPILQHLKPATSISEDDRKWLKLNGHKTAVAFLEKE